MSYEWWMSLAVAIPLGILSNLSTTKFQSWQVKRRNKINTKKINKLKKEYENVKKFVNNRDDYKEYLLIEIIKTLGFFVLTAIVALFFLFGIIMNPIISISKIDSLAIEFLKFFLFAVTMFFLIQIFDRAITIEIQYLRIKDFEKFENEVKQAIANDEKKMV